MHRPDTPAGPRRYQRREPETTALYAVLQQHLESFLAHLRADDDGLPHFVEKELRRFLRCGILAHGFARFRCTACGQDRLVAFSCKGRGFCPSCNGKRMTRMAAHLQDHVIPPVPLRQSVLSLPHRLRYRLAYDRALRRRVLGLFTRELQLHYTRRARAAGLDHAQTGAVTFVQRHGSALDLNLHFHTVCLDGVFTEQPDGALRFHPLPAPSDLEVSEVLSAVHARVHALLAREGLLDDDAQDPLAEQSPTLAAHLAGAVQQRMPLGPRAGKRSTRLGRDPNAPWVDKHLNCHASVDGFDLHAGVHVPAGANARRESLLRYICRPPLSHDRLSLRDDGRVLLTLKTPYFDGTSHLVLEPHELISRLVALIPRPHENQLVYHGVLAANAKLRARVVAFGREAATADSASPCAPQRPAAPQRPNNLWAHLMQRAFDLDVLECPRCSGRLKLVALINDARVATRLLDHLALRSHAPPVTPAGPNPYLDVA